MIIALSLWLAAAVGEAALCRFQPASKHRYLYGAGVLTVTIVSSTVLLFWYWPVWVAAWLIGAYRVVNVLRVLQRRLHVGELQRVSYRACVWLLTGQLLCTVVIWTSLHYNGMTLLYAYVIAQLLVALILLRSTVHTWRHTRIPAQENPLSDKELPSLSVLIPARNETSDLEESLASLVSSNYPKLEIIVLDDCSAGRRTTEIIRSYAHSGVRFIQGEVPDETRWLPKNQAYARLAREASGKLLLFCGVDVRFQPNSLRRLVELQQAKQKDMISVLPLRSNEVGTSLLQTMRYYWEICLPRRMFKRPPVLSTSWLITAAALKQSGGFEAAARSVTPEAHFARSAVVSDAYSFVRGNIELGVQSTKPVNEQYATTIRMRYPQLHRRIELVAATAALELLFLLGPIIGIILAIIWGIGWLLSSLIVGVLVLLVVYYYVAVGTRLNNAFFAWLLYPFAIGVDVVLLHVSMWKYEFSSVEWKGRNVCIPVMQVEPRLPKV